MQSILLDSYLVLLNHYLYTFVKHCISYIDAYNHALLHLSDSVFQTADDLKLQRLQCRRYKQEYIALIRILIKNLYLYPIAIITDTNECSKAFSTKLQQELNELIASIAKRPGNAVLHYQLTGASRYKSELSSILFDIKIKAAPVVILLCENDIAELIFESAAVFSLVSFNQVWLTINFNLEFENHHTPSQLLTISNADDASGSAPAFATSKELQYAVSSILVAADAENKGIVTKRYGPVILFSISTNQPTTDQL